MVSWMNIVALIVLGIPVSIFAAVLKRKKKKYAMIAVIALSVIYLIIWAALTIYPLESFYVTFETPEKAIEYYYPRITEIEYVLEGEQSCLVIMGTEKENENKMCLLKKAEHGYRYLPSVYFLRTVITESGFLYWVRGTEDYYIVGKLFHFEGNPDEIHLEGQEGDEIFYEVMRDAFYLDSSDRYIVICYGYIHYSDDYKVLLNGEPYSLAPLNSAPPSEDAQNVWKQEKGQKDLK